MTTHDLSGRSADNAMLARPAADARPGAVATQSRVVPGGHRAPAAAGVAAAGVPGPSAPCRFCAGSLQVLAVPVGPPGLLQLDARQAVWCPCARQPQLVHEAAERYLAQHGFCPTGRELGRLTGLTHHGVLKAIRRLEAAGLVEKGARLPRALRLVKTGGQQR